MYLTPPFDAVALHPYGAQDSSNPQSYVKFNNNVNLVIVNSLKDNGLYTIPI